MQPYRDVIHWRRPALLAVIAAVATPFAAGQQSRIERVESGLVVAADTAGGEERQSLAARMAHYQAPGVSIAVIDGGEVAWARGYGVAEAGSSNPVTPETLFQAASISKPITAMAALHMSRYGHFGLDEDVNQKLKSWKVPENDFTRRKPVTLRGLLTHSAGLTVHGFAGYAAGETVPTLLQVLDGVKPANSAAIRVDQEPGAAWRYSGGGYTVLQQLMIDSFGKPFPELMSIIVLRQAGMASSTFEQPPPEPLQRKAASGHGSDGRVLAGKWHTYPEMAAAGLWTTPSDLARFAIALQQAASGASERILSKSIAREMLTRQAGEFGLGVGLEGEGDAALFQHGGGNAGFRCLLLGFVERGQGAVVMTNSDNGFPLATEIFGAIAKEYGWPERRAPAAK